MLLPSARLEISALLGQVPTGLLGLCRERDVSFRSVTFCHGFRETSSTNKVIPDVGRAGMYCWPDDGFTEFDIGKFL